MTKYYNIDGQYKSWDYLHNSLGYTTSATESVSYNSVINWGSDAGNGYCTDTDDVEAEYFVSGVVGWYNINQLALTIHMYPSDVEDFMVEKNGVVSNAVRMTFDDTEYWLIEEEVKGENPYGWMTRSVAEQEGWHEYEDVTYEFILVDATTGRVTSGVERIDEIVFEEAGYFTIDNTDDVIFVEDSPFPVVCTHSGTQTAASIAPDASFDTGLQYYSSKLYIGETNDGQGNVTRYGWEAEEGTASVLPNVGDTVTFGNYPQATSTPEPIEWTVLAVDSTNNRALLIAKKVLDCQKYNSTSTNVTWETCSLRTWLNSTFFNAAFDSTEQGRIPLSHIENPSNPTYGTSGGNATDDCVFPLSIQEASNTAYFPNDDARKADATQKAINGGIYESSGRGPWWTRTPGSIQSKSAYVLTNGEVYADGDYVENTTRGVRPALWLNY